MSTLKECIITTFFPYNKIITVDSTTYKNIINNELNVFNNERIYAIKKLKHIKFLIKNDIYINKLIFYYHFNKTIKIWPIHVQSIIFGKKFNKTIKTWPSTVTTIVYGDHFNIIIINCSFWINPN